MLILTVGGTWGQGARPSSIFEQFVDGVTAAGHSVVHYNGGPLDDLAEIAGQVDRYDTIIWMPHVVTATFECRKMIEQVSDEIASALDVRRESPHLQPYSDDELDAELRRRRPTPKTVVELEAEVERRLKALKADEREIETLRNMIASRRCPFKLGDWVRHRGGDMEIVGIRWSSKTPYYAIIGQMEQGRCVFDAGAAGALRPSPSRPAPVHSKIPKSKRLTDLDQILLAAMIDGETRFPWSWVCDDAKVTEIFAPGDVDAPATMRRLERLGYIHAFRAGNGDNPPFYMPCWVYKLTNRGRYAVWCRKSTGERFTDWLRRLKQRASELMMIDPDGA